MNLCNQTQIFSAGALFCAGYRKLGFSDSDSVRLSGNAFNSMTFSGNRCAFESVSPMKIPNFSFVVVVDFGLTSLEFSSKKMKSSPFENFTSRLFEL